MTYADGQLVRLGDAVALGEALGEVVAVIDDGAYADGFPKGEWAYLGAGLLVRFQAFGIIHYRDPEPDLTLVARCDG